MFTSPQVRDTAIATTCSNMIMAGVLSPPEVGLYMAHIGKLGDNDLARQLAGSKMLLDGYYAQIVNESRN